MGDLPNAVIKRLIAKDGGGLRVSGSAIDKAVEAAEDFIARLARDAQASAVADKRKTLLLSGTGDLIEPDDGVLAIGSGSVPAMAAARALVQHTELDPQTIASEAMKVAASMDIYTNDQLTVETL